VKTIYKTAAPGDPHRFDLYRLHRRHMDQLWALLAQPLKFPARRRRKDREYPKAA
jgi:hypothetical protein